MAHMPFLSDENAKLLLARAEEIRQALHQAAPPAKGLRMIEVTILVGGW